MNINERFNKELLWQIEGKLSKGHIYKLGMPNDFMLASGIKNYPIELQSSIVKLKSNKNYISNHPFNLSDILNMPKAIAAPIAIFESEGKPNRLVILTELKCQNVNFIVILNVQKARGRETNQINNIISLYPKESNLKILKWFDSKNQEEIGRDILRNVNKEKALEWLSNASSNVSRLEISIKRITKIIQDFENPKYTPQKEIKINSSRGYKL